MAGPMDAAEAALIGSDDPDEKDRVTVRLACFLRAGRVC
jgi:hypothetical protein